MTEKEAIEQLYDIMIQFKQDISEAECGDKYAIEAKEDSENALKALDIAINALKEIQQYREIGTVEECREAVEKLARYEDLEQDGRLLELPCKIGTDTYVVYTGTTGKNPVIMRVSFDYGMIPLWEKAVFSTKEAAEAALKERSRQ